MSLHAITPASAAAVACARFAAREVAVAARHSACRRGLGIRNPAHRHLRLVPRRRGAGRTWTGRACFQFSFSGGAGPAVRAEQDARQIWRTCRGPSRRPARPGQAPRAAVRGDGAGPFHPRGGMAAWQPGPAVRLHGGRRGRRLRAPARRHAGGNSAGRHCRARRGDGMADPARARTDRAGVAGADADAAPVAAACGPAMEDACDPRNGPRAA